MPEWGWGWEEGSRHWVKGKSGMQCGHYRGPSKPMGSSGPGMAFLSPTLGEGPRPRDVCCLWEGVQLGQSNLAPLVQEQFPKRADSCGKHPQTWREPAIQFWRGIFWCRMAPTCFGSPGDHALHLWKFFSLLTGPSGHVFFWHHSPDVWWVDQA